MAFFSAKNNALLLYIEGRGVNAEQESLSNIPTNLPLNKGGIVTSEQQEKARVHLEEMKQQIETLVTQKGFYNKPEDIPKKLLFAFIELGEASDAWKKGLPEEKIAEELIDVIFYVLDASRLACPNTNMDQVFKKKLEKNLNRPYQYGEGHRQNTSTDQQNI